MNTTRKFSVSDIRTDISRPIPNFYVIYSHTGGGKTTLGTMFPKPLFIMTRQELGLLTLMNNMLVQQTPHVPYDIQTWPDLFDVLDGLIDDAREHVARREPLLHKTLVLDTMNGSERLMHEHVCQRLFKSDWKQFVAFDSGPKACVSEWILFLNRLNTLRTEYGMTIVLLSHMQQTKYPNPEGADYDRFVPAVHKDTWSITDRVATAVLFLRYDTVDVLGGNFTDPDPRKNSKGKATGGGQRRILCTERRPTYDAKNQLGLPPEIDMGESAEDGWANFVYYVQQARKEAHAKMHGESQNAMSNGQPESHEVSQNQNGGDQ